MCVSCVSFPTDSYRSLPQMLAVTETGQPAGSNMYTCSLCLCTLCTCTCVSTLFFPLSAVNVLLSLDETYADVVPVRENSDSPSAYM